MLITETTCNVTVGMLSPNHSLTHLQVQLIILLDIFIAIALIEGHNKAA